MTSPWLLYPLAFILGSIIGSFLNVCIYRLPRDESIFFPPSHCPSCKKKINPGDNVPVLSYLILRGRCRHCGEKISPVYPLVEILTASLFLLFTHHLGLVPGLAPYLVFVSAMIVIFFIDLEHQIIPDVITLPGILLGLAFSPLLPHTLLEGIIGALGGGAFFYLVAVLSRGGMGGGDIKMVTMMGAFLGWKILAVAIFLALLIGSAVGISLLATRIKGRKDPIPFGPFLVIGSITAALWGREIIDWYLKLKFS
jgi:leader peptidase (prepilin peptidase)/N-methyltransferase